MLMLIDAPGINSRCKVDRDVQGIFELHTYRDRLGRCEARRSRNCHVWRRGNGAGSVQQAHASRQAKEEHLQWAAYRRGPDILECHGPVESLADATIRQARGCNSNLTGYVHWTLRDGHTHRLRRDIAGRIRDLDRKGVEAYRGWRISRRTQRNPSTCITTASPRIQTKARGQRRARLHTLRARLDTPRVACSATTGGRQQFRAIWQAARGVGKVGRAGHRKRGTAGPVDWEKHKCPILVVLIHFELYRSGILRVAAIASVDHGTSRPGN